MGQDTNNKRELKMGKFTLIIGDMHFGVRNDSGVFLDYMEQWCTNELFPLIDETGVKHVIQTGDLFDRRKFTSSYTLSRVKKFFFDPLAARGVRMDIVIGNHDSFFRQTIDVNTPSLLIDSYKNIFIHQTPEEISIGDTKFLMIPWVCEANENEIKEAIKQSTAAYCVGHFELVGYLTNAFGMPFETDHAYITDTDLEKFKLVFSGHFHHRSFRKNILYCGTPYELTWSDYNDEKAIYLFDHITHETDAIPTKARMFYEIKVTANGIHYDSETIKDKFVKVFIDEGIPADKVQRALDVIMAKSPCDIKIIDANKLKLMSEFGEYQPIDAVSPDELFDRLIQQSIPDLQTRSRLKRFMDTLQDSVKFV